MKQKGDAKQSLLMELLCCTADDGVKEQNGGGR